ncbi:scarecrow-like protein 33 [Canna indica]|uniref:Scarecrow-like protein 33 n=1 Tax=Canna indica TaxID=4628 RepID=A0AAQ3KCQ9_9LILI|nr:scarecrow-like protein 33 [Canna indica]
MGTGIRDFQGVISEFKHELLFSDQITGNGCKLRGLQPATTTTTQRNGFVELQNDPLVQTPSYSISDSGAPYLFGSIENRGFSYDHLFTEENALSFLELGGSQQFSNQSSLLGLPDANPGFPPSVSTPNSNIVPSLSPGTEVEASEDSEMFSDIVLNYIDRMLMEEKIDEKFHIYPENPAILAAEKPFYEILGEKFPPLPDQLPLISSNFSDSLNHSISHHHGNPSGSTVIDKSWPHDPVQYSQLQTNPILIDYSSPSSFSSNSFGNIIDVVGEPPLLSTLTDSDLLTQSQQAWQFQKGLDEARKFLPSDDKLVIDLEAHGFYLAQQTNKEAKPFEVKEEDEDKEHSVHPSRGRKNPHGEDLDLEEGRSNKQSAVCSEETHRTKMFDEVLLCSGEKCANSVDKLRVKLQNEVSKIAHSNSYKGSSSNKGRGKKQSKREVVDLRTLLIHCAQAVATDDRRCANELLKQIRQHSSPHGDANQRLAHWFADGLQARLAGTGSLVYHSLVIKRNPVTEILKAYQLYLAACPFKKISHFFSTQTILNVAEKATKLHIIDFGIYYGFQWPCFMQRLASRPGGPPKLRMTGIDVPMHGFRPTELIDETGQRLADYARSFDIPFEYHAIATKWETIQVKDLNIDKDEVVVVNCLYRFRNLMDGTVLVDSPRDIVLNTVRKINPDVFIHGVLNGTYGAPFFVTRFREALFHFSSLFDMIETNVPHEDEPRRLIEKALFGREAINVISCEGTERVERPESYKQWQVRNLRAGFTQLPLNLDIMKKAKNRVKSFYHKDFVVDEDSQWLLQGWKGRIIYALSTWKPKTSC